MRFGAAQNVDPVFGHGRTAKGSDADKVGRFGFRFTNVPDRQRGSGGQFHERRLKTKKLVDDVNQPARRRSHVRLPVGFGRFRVCWPTMVRMPKTAFRIAVFVVLPQIGIDPKCRKPMKRPIPVVSFDRVYGVGRQHRRTPPVGSGFYHHCTTICGACGVAEERPVIK